MSKIRILIVDDAVVVRRMLTDLLAADPDIEVAGVAANGRIALSKIPQVNPDLVTLDVEMPEMDGLETLREVRKTYPRLPVIMFSTLTERGATATLDALTLGANDYVTKPANVGSVTTAIQRIRDELIPRIKALCPHKAAPAPLPRPALPTSNAPRNVMQFQMPAVSQPARPLEVVVIGVSTGGPNALAALLPEIPADFPVPIVIVQHMPVMFTRFLAERLNTSCAVQVREAAGGEALHPGQVWIAPGGQHLVVEREGLTVRLRTNMEPPENSCRPAVDVLFRSVARVYGNRALAVVLTGMGHDGLHGCEEVRATGGQVVVQDENSSVVWGMPGAVAQQGLAEKVLPLNQVAGEIRRRIQAGRALPLTTHR